MKRNDIRLLLLDFDGTLIDYRVAEYHAIREVLTNWGIEEVEYAANRYNDINEGLWARFRRGEIGSESIRKMRFELLFKELGLARDPLTSNREYLEAFISHSRVEPSVLDGVRRLKKAGYFLMVLTNGFHDTQTRRLVQSGILPFLDGYLTSEQVSSPKPSPAMFEKALSKFDAMPHEALMVGDSVEADVGGASALGISSILIGEEMPTQPPFPDAVFPHFEGFVSFWLDGHS